jgi:hypothetical protein
VKSKILSLFIFVSIIYGNDFYYSFGKKVYLTPLVQDYSISRNKNDMKFYLKNGKKVAIDKNILVKFKEISDIKKEKILNFFNIKKIDEITSELWLVSVDNIKNTLPISNKLSLHKDIKYAHPDFYQKIQNRTLPSPKDPLFSKSYYLKKNDLNPQNPLLNIAKIFTITKGDNVKIGLIDDGLETTHEDLKDNIAAYVNTSNIKAKADLYLFEEEKHGTEMSGIIGAVENNKGSVGIAPNSRIYLAKHNGERRRYRKISDFLNGFKWLEEQNVSIINNSWGTYDVDEALKDFIIYLGTKARNKKGIVIVFACGNETKNLDYYNIKDESEISTVIGVGSIKGDTNKITYYSNFGKNLDLFTIGDNILTTIPKNKYGNSSGTSPSSAIVSGVISLMFSINPSLSVDEVKNILYSSATIKMTHKNITYPVLNAYNAIQMTLKKQTRYEIEEQLILSNTKKIIGEFSYFDFDNTPKYLDFILTYNDKQYKLFGQNISDTNIFGLKKIRNKLNLTRDFYLVNRFGINNFSSKYWILIDSITMKVYILEPKRDKLIYKRLLVYATISPNKKVKFKRYK